MDRLYSNNRNVRFIASETDSGVAAEGELCGIGHSGELLTVPRSEETSVHFVTGESDVR